MRLQIECADRNGDVFIDLVDRSNLRKPIKIATIERSFQMKEHAHHIVRCVNNSDVAPNAIRVFLKRWERSGPNGSAQWEKFDAAILGLREALTVAENI